jgi:hypothetical protein
MRKEQLVPKKLEGSTQTVATSAKKPRTPKARPAHEDIARRAYEIYLERGSVPGTDLENWSQAERELMKKGQTSRRKTTARANVA